MSAFQNVTVVNSISVTEVVNFPGSITTGSDGPSVVLNINIKPNPHFDSNSDIPAHKVRLQSLLKVRSPTTIKRKRKVNSEFSQSIPKKRFSLNFNCHDPSVFEELADFEIPEIVQATDLTQLSVEAAQQSRRK